MTLSTNREFGYALMEPYIGSSPFTFTFTGGTHADLLIQVIQDMM